MSWFDKLLRPPDRTNEYAERIRKAELAHSLVNHGWWWTGKDDDKGIANGDDPRWQPLPAGEAIISSGKLLCQGTCKVCGEALYNSRCSSCMSAQ